MHTSRALDLVLCRQKEESESLDDVIVQMP
jgi:hypothetical protein